MMLDPLPKFIMLVGFPGVGKSTLIQELRRTMPADTYVYSTDHLIEKWAEEEGLTYNEVMNRPVKGFMASKSIAEAGLKAAINAGAPIIWDQTNVTAKKRTSTLKTIPDGYFKECHWFQVDNDAEWRRRLASRPNKPIPQHVLDSMIAGWQTPTKAEGWDVIIRHRV